MKIFWKRWLDIWCLGVIVFGGVLALTAFEGFEAGTLLFLNLISSDPHIAFGQTERFAFGLMGAITMGWGLTFFYFFRAAHASHLGLGYKMYRNAVIILVFWNLIDGYVSYITGFRFNIISNLILSLGMIIPLYISGVLRD